MFPLPEKLSNALNSYAKVSIIYNLGYKNDFITKFPKIKKSILDNIWLNNQRTFRYRFPDATHLTPIELEAVSIRLHEFNDTINNLSNYLDTSCDVPKSTLYKQKVINNNKVERKIRNQLGQKYLSYLSEEINKLILEYEKTRNYKISCLIEKYKYKTIFLTAFCVLLSPFLIDRLTPVEELSLELYNDSKYTYRIGAECWD